MRTLRRHKLFLQTRSYNSAVTRTPNLETLATHRWAAQAAKLRGCVPTAPHSKSDGYYKSICLFSLIRWAQAQKAAPFLMGVVSLSFLRCTVTRLFLLRQRLSASLCCCPGPCGTVWPTCSMAIRRASAAVVCNE